MKNTLKEANETIALLQAELKALKLDHYELFLSAMRESKKRHNDLRNLFYPSNNR